MAAQRVIFFKDAWSTATAGSPNNYLFQNGAAYTFQDGTAYDFN